jgi:hypothetical protein
MYPGPAVRRSSVTGAPRRLMLVLAAIAAAGVILVALNRAAGSGADAASTVTGAATDTSSATSTGTGTGTGTASTTATTAVAPQLTSTTALSPAGVPSVRVGAPLNVRPVQPGFIGISTEWYAIEWYGGTATSDLDSVFLHLVSNLAPGQSPVLRIGGDSTDWAYLKTRGVKQVKALKVTVSTQDIKILAAMARELNAKLLLGINLEADNLKLAENIARTTLAAVGANRVLALEIGNEPELYDVLGWYANAAGQPVYGRAKGYSIADYTQEFNTYAAHLPDVPLAGPATGSVPWGGTLASFVSDARRLKVVTVHTYPLKLCGTRPGLASYPTIAKLLAPSSTYGLAHALVGQAETAHAAGKAVRVDELNSVACFGLKGVSDTYASALWSLETAAQFARLGFDGLNITTVPSAVYRLFVTSHAGGTWSAQVMPDYYGFLDFADSVPTGSKILATPDTGANPQVLAVRTPAGQTHVVIVNTGAARRLAVRIPGSHGAEATASDLTGPSLSSSTGVRLGGQSFGASSTTGALSGTATATAVKSVRGAYVVALAAHSATTLSVG